VHRRNCATKAQLSPCLFEFVYFARPDSVIDKIPVYQVRMNIGRKLAAQIMKEWPQTRIDAVIPIPETSRPTAISLAEQMGVDFREGFVKNRYIGRTFIMPGQAIRKKSVRQKLSIIEQEFKNKNVLLIDDSIVRGTTCQEIIQMAREAGANEVYFASAAPPIRYQNIYGIDMPSRYELVAHNKTIDQIRETIGADKLIYLDLSELTDAVKMYNSDIQQFESSVFDGVYLTGMENHYLAAVEKSRSENAKESRSHEENVCQIDLYNDE
jgi:amidophosphoribosyltransferase